MMKKAYVSVLTVITILCVVFGTMYHTGLFFRHAAFFPFAAANFGNGSSNDISFSDEYKDVTSVFCDMDLMNVTINTTDGDSVKVNYEGKEKLKPIINCKNGALSLSQADNTRLSFREMNLTDEKSKITISLPKDTVLKAMGADLDMGNMEIYDITSDRLDLDVDMGSVKGSGLTLGNAEIDSNMGNVELTVKDIKDLSVSTDMGNVKVMSEKDLSGYSFSCSADMGSIAINDKKISNEYEKEGSDGSITIDTDMGSVSVEY